MQNLRDYAPVPVRVMLAIGFLYHGLPKFGSDHEGFVGMLQGIGVPAPGLMSWVVALVEVAGGLALLLGVWVAIAAVPLIVNMLVAMFTVHLPNGFNFLNITGMTDAGPQFGMPGVEVNLLYLAGLLSLVFSGAGALSVERRFAVRPTG